MQPADWGHHKWSRAYAGPSLPEALNEPAAVFLAGQPLAYLALYLHPQSRLYQLASNGTTIRPGGRFERQIQAGLERAWPGEIWLVYFTREPPDQAIIDLLERYDLEVDRDPVACRQVEGERLYGKAVACRLQHR